MACYHPLKGFVLGQKSNGKQDISIQSYDCDHVEVLQDGRVMPAYDSVRSPRCFRFVKDFIDIPCGQCIGCRLDYSRQWANRCLLELEDYDSAYFVTLTYDDNHIPLSFSSDPETGLASPSRTLCKRDVQLFFKRLRKACPNDHIRYYGCGEYGPSTFRPHYHLIIFGLHLDDLEPWSRSPQGYQYFRSPLLERVWSFPRRDDNGQYLSESPSTAGYVLVGAVTWESCAYTARYMTKKLKGDSAEFYSTFNLTPPFSLMSRKPGIARKYYDEHGKEIFEHDYIALKTDTGGRKIYPPNYYHRLFDVDYPEDSAKLKEHNRMVAQLRKDAKLAKTDLSYLDYLYVEEQVQNKRSNALKRDLI